MGKYKVMAYRTLGLKWLPALPVILCLVLSAVHGWAAETNTLKIPLSKLSPARTADLRGTSAGFSIKLPIPERWDVLRADVHLEYFNSSALLSTRSQLVVRVNGYPLTQVTLKPEAYRGALDISIPPSLLLPEYNDLDIQANQNYTERCSDPSAPELWTNLELTKSYLDIEYSRRSVPMSLAAVAGYVFDPKIPGDNQVHLVLEDTSEDWMRLAAITAAAVAIRFDYRPVAISMSGEPKPGVDNIVLGNRTFVSGVLKDAAPKSLPGNLGVTALPSGGENTDSGQALIYITGDTMPEIETAVRAFSVLSYPWPDRASVNVSEVGLPAIDRYSGKRMLAPAESYTLRDLGFQTVTLGGLNPGTAGLSFRIPADFHVPSNEALTVSLHLVYGAALRSDSTLNIRLNDKFAGAISLRDPLGGRFSGYRVDIPNTLLRGGLNTLSFEPVLTPSVTGECTLMQTKNLALTIFEDSFMELPDMGHWVRMPELALFFRDGFPMARYPDWRETIVYLSDQKPETMTAALNLVALICQKNGIAPYGVQFSYNPPDKLDKEILAIGLLESMPADFLNNGMELNNLQYTFPAQTPRRDRDMVKSAGGNSERAPEPNMARVTLDSAPMGNRFLISEFESPSSASRTVLLVGAGNGPDLLKGTLALWDPNVQAQCVKGLALVDLNHPKLKVAALEGRNYYFLGKISAFKSIDRLIHTNIWLFYGFIAVLVLLLAIIIYRLLAAQKRKRLETASEKDKK